MSQSKRGNNPSLCSPVTAQRRHTGVLRLSSRLVSRGFSIIMTPRDSLERAISRFCSGVTEGTSLSDDVIQSSVTATISVDERLRDGEAGEACQVASFHLDQPLVSWKVRLEVSILRSIAPGLPACCRRTFTSTTTIPSLDRARSDPPG